MALHLSLSFLRRIVVRGKENPKSFRVKVRPDFFFYKHTKFSKFPCRNPTSFFSASPFFFLSSSWNFFLPLPPPPPLPLLSQGEARNKWDWIPVGGNWKRILQGDGEGVKRRVNYQFRRLFFFCPSSKKTLAFFWVFFLCAQAERRELNIRESWEGSKRFFFLVGRGKSWNKQCEKKKRCLCPGNFSFLRERRLYDFLKRIFMSDVFFFPFSFFRGGPKIIPRQYHIIFFVWWKKLLLHLLNRFSFLPSFLLCEVPANCDWKPGGRKDWALSSSTK